MGLLAFLRDLFGNKRPEYEFPNTDVKAETVGQLLWVQKYNTRIQITEGEKEFYLANGWVEV